LTVRLLPAACDPPANRPATGVKSYDVSLDTQTAVVVADPALAYETVLRTIKKTGKKVNSGEADGEVKSVELAE
jgi:copper chaperone